MVPGGTSNDGNIFIRDRQTGETRQVSVATNGTQGNRQSEHPAISADGRYVTFESPSSTLVPNDTNGPGTYDVFVRDTVLGQTTRVSVTTDGNPDPNALVPQRVVVRLRGGAEFSWSCDAMLAHPTRPLTTEQHLAKFRRCVQFSAVPLPTDATERLIAAVDRLESMEDVRLLGALSCHGLPDREPPARS